MTNELLELLREFDTDHLGSLLHQWAPCDNSSDYQCAFCGERANTNHGDITHREDCFGVKLREALQKLPEEPEEAPPSNEVKIDEKKLEEIEAYWSEEKNDDQLGYAASVILDLVSDLRGSRKNLAAVAQALEVTRPPEALVEAAERARERVAQASVKEETPVVHVPEEKLEIEVQGPPAPLVRVIDSAVFIEYDRTSKGFVAAEDQGETAGHIIRQAIAAGREGFTARISKALMYAVRYGGIEGDHHKAWVIDQMVRALTGCPMVVEQATDANGKPYTYETQGKSDEYLKLVAYARGDGPDPYDWDEGIAP